MGGFCITSTEENSDKSSFVWFWCWLTMMNQLTGAPAAEPPDPGQELLLLLLPHPLIPSCGQSQGKPASGSSARTNTSERCASHAAKPQLKLLQKCQYYSCCFCLHAIATKSGSVLQLSWFWLSFRDISKNSNCIFVLQSKNLSGCLYRAFFWSFLFYFLEMSDTALSWAELVCSNSWVSGKPSAFQWWRALLLLEGKLIWSADPSVP